MDTGVRCGKLWPDRTLPSIPDVGGSSVVTAVGADVTDLTPGDRVAWAMCREATPADRSHRPMRWSRYP
ncbi:alcohol dehydrogenase catalytic domain-containing protein [Sphingomonas sp. FARSPH]|uniref:alcohol dehydrogenase catalytic domain-containing protein n=2 Tax=Sphingomonas TaxID=13687 RepID=UPI003FA6E286